METKYYYWIGGGAALIAAVWLFLRRGQPAAAAAAAKVEQVAPAAAGGAPLPFYLSGAAGGVTSQPAQAGGSLPLGGEVWQDKTVPLSENPDVKIAEINASVALAQVEAAKSTAALYAPAPVTPPPAVNAGSSPAVPAKTATMTDITAFLTPYVTKPGGITAADSLAIQTKAAEYGVSASQVASGLNIVTNTQNFNASTVNGYLSSYGIPTLQ